MPEPKRLEDLTFYAVRSADGKFFRRKGYCGYGESWVADAAKARIYTRLVDARRVLTYFAVAHPDYPPPEVVEIAIGTVTTLDSVSYIEGKRRAKAEEATRREVRRRERDLADARANLERAMAEVKRLTQP